MMTPRGRRAAATFAALVLAGVLVAPAVADVLSQTDYRFSFPFGIRSNNTGASLFVRQDGTGSIATFRDNATDEYTFDQAMATFLNPITMAVGKENVGVLPTIDSAAITAASNGALWTVGASETWLVHQVFCSITTNFDCTGDDCTLVIGDGNDIDGFLTLADAELQAADTEGTGFAAGWQGLVAATQGAYVDPEQTFIYASTDTVDIKIEDTSAATDPAAGAGTCYIRYTRFQ